MEKTLILLKPCCLQRSLIGEIISKFEKKGFKIIALKMVLVDKKKAEYHYSEHNQKYFFNSLINHITSSPIVAMVLESDNAVKLARIFCGATNAVDALPGTIRGDYVMHTNMNLVHSSDSPLSAEREIANFFEPSEIFDYSRAHENWF